MARARSTVEWKTVVSEEGVQQLLRFGYTVATGEEARSWALFQGSHAFQR